MPKKVTTKTSKASKSTGKKKVAEAPAFIAAKTQEVKKRTNPLFEKRPKNFGIGGDIQPKKDLTRFVKWPKYVDIQRKKSNLMKRLKIPPPIHQFKQTLEKSMAREVMRFLEKYRPDGKMTRKQRIAKRAEMLAKTKTETAYKKKIWVKQGIQTVTTAVEQKKAKMVVIASDVDPLEIVLFLPALCRKMGVPYCIINGKARLGRLVHRKTCAVVCLTQVEDADRTHLNKMIESIKTNYNDRGDEIRKNWGGGTLGNKSKVKLMKLERAKANEQKKRV